MKIIRIVQSHNYIDVVLLENNQVCASLYFSKATRAWRRKDTPDPRLSLRALRSVFLVASQAPVIVTVCRGSGELRSITFRERSKRSEKYYVRAYSHATAQVPQQKVRTRTKAMAQALAQEFGRQHFIEKTNIYGGNTDLTQYWPRFGDKEIKR